MPDKMSRKRQKVKHHYVCKCKHTKIGQNDILMTDHIDETIQT